MRNKLLPMKLSRDEENFLRRWIYDEVHYQEGMGPAKQLQLHHQVRPADLAILTAAALPNPADQEAASCDLPPEKAPHWPWSKQEFLGRVLDARKHLEASRAEQECSN